ncbi:MULTISPECIES: DUF4186 domain-containing protein [unclassified Caballeronia]|uniref:DUF4186 domain-containing protein n=1 Tax=unclassified Caballeronia TaxID=2646786 RepID=UPI002858FF40|nr:MULTISPECIES: DUF4186 domain-containing protein [unclassified Caballeronia]MDR5754075.1 DUF4186 domain-containing protein [Caballeronia sp. LZ024]MDR5840454.1 DUF4186 domain-containing protein [Caballeronia sp. LZ031]
MRALDSLFEALTKSAFRRRFSLGARELAYLHDKGLDEVIAHAHELIDKRLAPAMLSNDGKQTPFRGHPVFIAQHATATCCRGCLAKWHGIEAGRALDDAERQHVVDAIARWLREEAKREVKPRKDARQSELPF